MFRCPVCGKNTHINSLDQFRIVTTDLDPHDGPLLVPTNMLTPRSMAPSSVVSDRSMEESPRAEPVKIRLLDEQKFMLGDQWHVKASLI